MGRAGALWSAEAAAHENHEYSREGDRAGPRLLFLDDGHECNNLIHFYYIKNYDNNIVAVTADHFNELLISQLSWSSAGITV